jgi:hypothetical protein
MLNVPRAVSLALALSTSACAHMRPESPPPPRPADPAQACVHDGALTLTRASGGASIGGGGSIRFGTGGSAFQPVYDPTPTRVISGGGTGLAAYHGQEILDVDEVLAVVDDSELRAYHEATLDPYASGDFVYWARPLWITLLVGGMALAGVGAGIGLSADPDPVTGATDFGPMLPLAGAGIGGMLVSIPFLVLDLNNVDSYGELFTRRRAFVGDAAATERFVGAVERHNAEVARRCGR